MVLLGIKRLDRVTNLLLPEAAGILSEIERKTAVTR